MYHHRPSHRLDLMLPIHRRGSAPMICSTLLVLMLMLTSCGGGTVSSSPLPATTRVPSPTPTQPLHPLVTYHGGRVQLSPSAYLIFWGQSWQTDSTLHSAMQALESYFTHVGASSYESILTQYSMQNPDGSRSYITNSMRFSDHQVWLDPAVPQADDRSCGVPTVSDASVLREITHALSAAHWIKDSLNATYFVYTPPAFAIAEPGWGCSGKDYCADHEWSSDLQVSYAVDPANCARPGTLAEKLVWTSAHEQFESITDPTPGRSNDTLHTNEGWFHLDPQQHVEEIGDLCTRVQGSRDLHGVAFHLQAMWSNRDNACMFSS
jgi:hypothetical protein